MQRLQQSFRWAICINSAHCFVTCMHAVPTSLLTMLKCSQCCYQSSIRTVCLATPTCCQRISMSWYKTSLLHEQTRQYSVHLARQYSVHLARQCSVHLAWQGSAGLAALHSCHACFPRCSRDTTHNVIQHMVAALYHITSCVTMSVGHSFTHMVAACETVTYRHAYCVWDCDLKTWLLCLGL